MIKSNMQSWSQANRQGAFGSKTVVPRGKATPSPRLGFVLIFGGIGHDRSVYKSVFFAIFVLLKGYWRCVAAGLGVLSSRYTGRCTTWWVL